MRVLRSDAYNGPNFNYVMCTVRKNIAYECNAGKVDCNNVGSF